MEEINYSFIIPHKNLPGYLRRCLNSIPHRDDIQIIVVDDNSAPSIVDFNTFPGLNEPCTEIIFTKEGKGAGYARNVGLKSAKGKWIIFLDSDDFFVNNAIQILDQHLYDKNDIIFFDIKSVYAEDLAPSNLNAPRSSALERYKNNVRKIDIYCRYFYTQPWGKMIKRELIKKYDISFEESRVANDYWFSVVSGYHANTISYDESVLYIYTERKGSLSNIQIPNMDVALIRLGVYHRVQQFFDDNKISFIPFFELSFWLYRNYNEYRSLVIVYLRDNNISIPYFLYRLLKGKIYKFIAGIKE